jgi:hypothetical protein
MFPLASTATELGPSNLALDPGPSSHVADPPAMVVTAVCATVLTAGVVEDE